MIVFLPNNSLEDKMRFPKETLDKYKSYLYSVSEARVEMQPFKSRLFYQDDIPERLIYNLNRGGKMDFYYCTQISSLHKIIIPTGDWIFVVTVDNPFQVICACAASIKSLGKTDTPIGHSSLARERLPQFFNENQNSYIHDRINDTDKCKGNKSYIRDVFLAGRMFFVDGRLKRWDNHSGHYQIPKNFVLTNIPAPLKSLLQPNLFETF